MDIDYLGKVDLDLSNLFGRTVETYAHLETKAKYIASAFLAIMAAYVSAFISGFDGLSFWKQAAIVGLLPSICFAFYHLIDALKVRDYDDGFMIRYSAEDEPTKVRYLTQKIRALQEYIPKKSAHNLDKADAINRTFVCLVSAIPASAISTLLVTVLVTFLARNPDNFVVVVARLLLVGVATAICAYVFSNHFNSRLADEGNR